MYIGESLGHQRYADNDLGAGADTGEETADDENHRPLGEALQRSEYRHHHDAKGQRADSADIVADNTETETSQGPAEQAGHAQQPADAADLTERGVAE